MPSRLGLTVAITIAGLLAAMLLFTDQPRPEHASAIDLPAMFQRGTLDVVISEPTSLAFGPDGRLYVSSQEEIRALTIDPATQDVLAVEQIASGLEGVLGLAFDPTVPASPVVLYASRQDLTATPGFQGTVSTFTSPAWTQKDVITNLPTSAPEFNHLTNGLAFDDQGVLMIAQGSSTDAGIATGAFWPETPLSAAILRADVNAPAFDGAITYDPAGPPADSSVLQTGGDVDVYAAGLRNSYDLVVHSNGFVYATDNGGTGGPPSIGCTTSGVFSSTADELNLVEEGDYYGFPNRNRGLNIPDPRQCVYHAPGEGSGADFTGPIAILPNHCSCDGIVEYTSAALGGALQGDLLYVEWTFGNVTRVELSPDGRSVDAISILASGFSMPLDVTVGPDGTIYVAEFGGDAVSYLAPDSDVPTSTMVPTAAATSTTGPTATTTETPPTATGDVDCDSDLTSIDAALMLQLDAGLIASLPCQSAGDVNGDGSIDSLDAAVVLQVVVGLIPDIP